MSNHTFVFSNGRSVGVRPVSPLLMMELRRKFPEPQPPLNEVDFGDGKKVKEPNVADPLYLAQKATYEVQMEERLRNLIIQRGVVYTLSAEDKAQVVELREFWKDTYDQVLAKNDTEVFVTCLLIESEEDLTNLFNAVLRRSQPTEAAVADFSATFPS